MVRLCGRQGTSEAGGTMRWSISIRRVNPISRFKRTFFGGELPELKMYSALHAYRRDELVIEERIRQCRQSKQKNARQSHKECTDVSFPCGFRDGGMEGDESDVLRFYQHQALKRKLQLG